METYSFLKNLHSGIAYLVLIFVVVALLNAIIGVVAKRSFNGRDFSFNLVTLIMTHIQFLVGIVMYFMSPYFKVITDGGMGDAMSDPSLRKLVIEHPITMLIVVALVTIGYSKHKKKNLSAAKYKTIAIFYGVALLAILWAIPWSNWIK